MFAPSNQIRVIFNPLERNRSGDPLPEDHDFNLNVSGRDRRYLLLQGASKEDAKTHLGVKVYSGQLFGEVEFSMRISLTPSTALFAATAQVTIHLLNIEPFLKWNGGRKASSSCPDKPTCTHDEVTHHMAHLWTLYPKE
jgi:hypothetical protein